MLKQPKLPGLSDRVVMFFKVLGLRSSLLFSCLFAFSLLSACTSTDSDAFVDGGRVVGKSSFVRPKWIDRSLHMNEARTLGLMTYKKKNVHILELGLKQAQTEALAQGGKRFDSEFAQLVAGLVSELERGGEQGKRNKNPEAGSADQIAKLKDLSFEVSKTFDEPVVKVESVYWEEIEKFEAADYNGTAAQELVREYQISVLVSLEITEITDRLAVLLEKLGADPRQASIVAAIEGSFAGLRAARKESELEKKEVEAINTEMDSLGAQIESSQDAQGPTGRKVPQVMPGENQDAVPDSGAVPLETNPSGAEQFDAQQIKNGMDSHEQ